mgnify:CR=1 FL=1
MKRILLAGFVGSLIIFAPFTPIASFFLTPIPKIILSLLMVWLAFGFKTPRYFLTNLFTFYLSTFAAGGALLGFHYLGSFNMEFVENIGLSWTKGFGDPISWLFVIIAFPFALYFSKTTFSHYETAKLLFDQIVPVRLGIRGKIVELKGLLDSGNQLYEPFSKRPVMIVSLEKTRGIFPENLLPIFTNVELIGNLDTKTLESWQLSVIPYRAVGREHRLLLAVKPDFVEIEYRGETLSTKEVSVAFINQKLSSEDAFDAIIHPKMINQRNSRVS